MKEHAFEAPPIPQLNDTQAWLALMEEGPRAFNVATRHLNLRARVNLRGVCLDGRDLNDFQLGRTDLSFASLKGCRVRGGALSEARLEGTDLEGIEDTSLSEDLTLVRLLWGPDEVWNADKGQWSNKRLLWAQLEGLDLGEKNLERMTFKQCWMDGADLSRCRMVFTTFENTSLRGANFAGSRMKHTYFPSSDLTEANFEAARLDSGGFDSSVLERARFRGAQLHDVSMIRARAFGLDLREVHMVKGDLAGLLAPALKPDGAVFEGCCLDLILQDFDLRGARLEGCKICDAILDGADLRGVDLSTVRLSDVLGLQSARWDDVDGV